jgi:hypothetical protein
VVVGQPILLENLCPTLANGYLRMYAFYLYGISLGLSGSSAVGCEPAMSDEDLLVALFGDVEQARSQLCAADGGMMAINVEAITRAQTAGRLIYSPQAAGDCLAEGRNSFAAYGGLLRSIVATGNVDAGQQLVVSNCNGVIRGMQDEGEPCLSPLECSPLDAGVTCVHRLQADCFGVCQRFGLLGEECETRGNPECSGELACLRPGDTSRGLCAPPAGMGRACEVDGGTLNCAGGGACINGICVPATDGGTLAEGTGCEETAECLPGLVCSGSPSRCQSRAPLGEVCRNGSAVDRPCQPCLVCFEPRGADAGPDAGVIRRCVAAAGLDEACTAAPCEIGLACLSGTCRPLAKRGQACARDDGVPETADLAMRGNCLSPLDSCMGAPATCQPRVAEGASCQGPAGTLAVQGNCQGGLTCARASAAATTGTCQAAPNTPGASCGYRQDLTGSCDDTADGRTMECSARWDGGQGVCVLADEGALGEPCVDNYDCSNGHYCSGADGGATPGRCTAGGQTGEPCGYSVDAGWKDICLQGFCDNRVCTAPRATGEPCYSNSQCSNGLWCANDGGCMPRAMTGAACQDDEECAEGLACAPEGVCAASECVNYSSGCGGCGGCTDGSYVPTLLFFGALTHGYRLRRRKSRGV